jgi:hypothetical protein
MPAQQGEVGTVQQFGRDVGQGALGFGGDGVVG